MAGILRDLQGVVAVTAPSVPSLIRLRPGYFASAYAFWGADNREASLRFVPGAEAIGAQNANIELKASDASGNPYLGLTAMIASGLGGIEDGLELPEPISEDPGHWTPEQREARGIRRFAQNATSRSRTSRRRRASARRSAIRSRTRSSACAAPTPTGPTARAPRRSSPRTSGATDRHRI